MWSETLEKKWLFRFKIGCVDFLVVLCDLFSFFFVLLFIIHSFIRSFIFYSLPFHSLLWLVTEPTYVHFHPLPFLSQTLNKDRYNYLKRLSAKISKNSYKTSFISTWKQVTEIYWTSNILEVEKAKKLFGVSTSLFILFNIHIKRRNYELIILYWFPDAATTW